MALRAPDRGAVTILASASRTTTQTSEDYQGGTAMHLVLVMATVGTGSVTPKVQGKDDLGNYYDLLVGTAQTTDGTQVIKIGEGFGQVANGSAADKLPVTWRVVATANNANAAVYSVTASLL